MTEEKKCIKCGRILTEDELRCAFPWCTDCYRYEMSMCEDEPEDEYYYEMDE